MTAVTKIAFFSVKHTSDTYMLQRAQLFMRSAIENAIMAIEGFDRSGGECLKTIHFIDEGIDTGDILAQKKVVIDENETLKNSYKKLHFHIQRLFKQNYFRIKTLKIKPKKQKKGTFHLAKELKKLNLPSYDITIKELKELNNAPK